MPASPRLPSFTPSIWCNWIWLRSKPSLVPVLVEVRAPAGQGLGVVLTQVLGVPDLEAAVVHQRHQESRALKLTVGEHVAVDEPGRGTRRAGVLLPGDAVVEQPALRHELVVQEPEV